MRNYRLISSCLLACAAFAATQAQEQQAGVRDTKPVVEPNQPPALPPEARADIFMARKMYREAVEMYLSIKPPTAVVYNKVGIAYHQMADLDNAKKYYDRSLKLNKNYAEAVNNVGTIHYARKSYRRAVSSYKKALKLSPNSASIHSNLGTAYFARKDYKRAVEEYDLALSLDPEVFEHRSTQGVLLQERTVEERAKYHYYLAKTYAKAGRNELALQYIRKSLEEGFKERKRFMEDSEFEALRKLPEFEVLMKLEPRVL
jgi:tetratricopeptide (TPR) repeat protein